MTIDNTDPISVLQQAIEGSWSVTSIPNVFFTGVGSKEASPNTSLDGFAQYCILDFSDAIKEVRTNCSAIWQVPVTIKSYDISIASLRERVSVLKSFLGAGERALADCPLVFSSGASLMEVVTSRVGYAQIEATKAEAEFEVGFRLVVPVEN